MKKIILGSIIIFPSYSFAVTFASLSEKLYSTFLNSVAGILISAGVLLFLYGMITMITAEESKKKEKAKTRMLWGIIILFVMFSFWGLIKIFGETLDLENTTGYKYHNTTFQDLGNINDYSGGQVEILPSL